MLARFDNIFVIVQKILPFDYFYSIIQPKVKRDGSLREEKHY